MPTPDFAFERKLWKKDFKQVAGVDEVGRGSFAGPVVAGCVVFNKNIKIPSSVLIDDSKRLSVKKRLSANKWIKVNALAWGIGQSSASLITKIGMSKATKTAFRRAINSARRRLGKNIDFLLADAFFISFAPGLPTKRRKDKKGRYNKNPKGRQIAIVKGDQKSISIAAASIIAKVHRDKLMTKLGVLPAYKKYLWGKNKGYGTVQHRKAIKKYGITKYHRKDFIKGI